MTDQHHRALSSYQHLVERARVRWPRFREQRRAMLAAEGRFGTVAEKASENIVGALLTDVLDWTQQDLNWQLEHADLVVTRNFMKYLVVETKRAGLLRSSATMLASAFDQVRRYADEQSVGTVAVCDGHVLRAADVVDGGLRLRAVIDLDAPEAPVEHLWWISVNGIYRPAPTVSEPVQTPTATQRPDSQNALFPDDAGVLLHPKYHLPATCFAYVERAADPHSWKLPFRLSNGELDLKRLPKAIQALLSNYRGAKVGGIPDAAIPAVMRRLAEAAREAGKMPDQHAATASTYKRLAEALAQLPSA